MANTTSGPSTDKLSPSAPRPGTSRAKAPEELLPWLTCTLALDIPVLAFTVKGLLKLAPGSLVRTSCHQSSDIPLQVNGVAMAWTEFEVVGDSLAARITDLI
ncbi:MAG: FliM/FliN family flagellar motor switch protein [Janthinobacterium lividum]